MINSGIKVFSDFREEGIYGLSLLKTALQDYDINSVILSRPDNSEYDEVEMDLLLKNSEGIGISAISDIEYSELEKIVKHVKKRKKIFALHASERKREDIDKILDLKPDFLVHMIMASKSDLTRIKENDIPIVICPRSNDFYGLKTNFEIMKKIGVNIILGTDNAMLNSPNILDEIHFLKTKYNLFSDEELLKMSTYRPRKVLKIDSCILGSNSKADFIVLDKKSLRPLNI
jgi:cytosine/adenosine deaminase-related metal-dependent hydrolase